MDRNRAISLLRNPYGISEDEIREARRFAADEIERLESYIRSIKKYCNRALNCEGKVKEG